MDSIDGSALSRTTFSGLASGIDTSLLIQASLDAQRRPLTFLEDRRSALAEQQSLLRDFNTKLLGLRNAARDIDNRTSLGSSESFEEEFLRFDAQSSSETVITATATGEATQGTTSVRVNSLAQGAREVSEGFSTNDQPIAVQGETLDFDFGAGDERNFSITVGSGGASLLQLRDSINLNTQNQDLVTAQVLFDGSEYRLVVTSDETGADNDFGLTGTGATLGAGTFLDPAASQQGVDASLTIFGIAVSSGSNTVEGAIPGLTLELTGTSDPDDLAATEEITVTIDKAAVTERLQKFVDAYNEVDDFLGEQFAVDSVTNRSGPLGNDSFLRSTQRTVQRVVTDFFDFDGNAFKSLADIGLKLSSGSLAIDSEKLDEALAIDPHAIRKLLSGDGTENGEGVASRMASALAITVQSGDGTLARRDQSFDDQLDGLDSQILRFEERLRLREETLLAQFSRLESAISALQAQSSFLSSF